MAYSLACDFRFSSDTGMHRRLSYTKFEFRRIDRSQMMSGKLRTAVLVIAAGLSIIFSLQAQVTSETPNKITPNERRGKEIYLRGVSASGREIMALLGEIEVPASTVPCAGCHGLRGEGKTEGGVTAGNLTWTNLIKPYGHTHPSGRKHGPFT